MLMNGSKAANESIASWETGFFGFLLRIVGWDTTSYNVTMILYYSDLAAFFARRKSRNAVEAPDDNGTFFGLEV